MTATPPPGTPAAEHPIDAALVAGLLAEQHADLAALPLRELDSGWDNAIFRLGDELLVRLPRRAAAAGLIVNEQAWLPLLAARLPLPISAPLRVGGPGRGYPWRWSVLPWLPGSTADAAPPADSQAAALADFLRALHTPAPPDAPSNPVRGGPLSGRAPYTAARLERLAQRSALLTPRLRQIWELALAAPLDCAPTWLHGDLHPRNVLVERGTLSAVIDWGDLTGGDPATDLAAIWMLFDSPAARRAALERYGARPATRLRAMGWALHLGATLLDSGMVDNPRHAAIGTRTLRRLEADGP